MAVVGVDLVAQALWTGQINIQEPPVDRSYAPYYYWAETILLALGLIVMPLWMLYRERRKR